MLEFALVITMLVPMLLGVVVIGLNLTRSVKVTQFCRDSGAMFVRGVDFSLGANQDLLIQLAQGMGMTRAGGTGVVILSKITFIPASACVGVSPCNSNQNVVTQRLVVGNASLLTSNFGPVGRVTTDAQGNVSNYMTDPNAVTTSFGSVIVLNGNEFAYVSEVYFPSPELDMPGFQTGTGVYSRSIF